MNLWCLWREFGHIAINSFVNGSSKICCRICRSPDGLWHTYLAGNTQYQAVRRRVEFRCQHQCVSKEYHSDDTKKRDSANFQRSGGNSGITHQFRAQLRAQWPELGSRWQETLLRRNKRKIRKDCLRSTDESVVGFTAGRPCQRLLLPSLRWRLALDADCMHRHICRILHPNVYASTENKPLHHLYRFGLHRLHESPE